MRCALFVTALGLMTTGSLAHASPMDDPSLGGAVFTGPTHGHATSFFVNPAALGLTGRGWHLHLGGNARLDSISIDRKQVTLDGQLRPGETLSNHTLSPGGIIAWYSSFRDDKARLGVSLFTPTVQRFPSNEEGLQYHSRGGQIVQSMLTLAGSHRWGRILIGIGFSLGYSSLRLKFARDSALSGGSDSVTGINSDCNGAPCGYENPAARELYDIRVGNQASFGDLFSLKNISASIGLAYQVAPRSWIAFGYVALPGAFDPLTLSGSAAITRSPRDGGATEATAAEVGFSMAQMAFLGYRQPAFGSYDFVTDLRWQDWSRHNNFDIRLFGGDRSPEIPEWMPRRRNMRDVWRLSAGLETGDQEAYRYGARLRVETASVDDLSISPTLVGGTQFTLATGTELKFTDHWVFSLGYELSLFPTIDASGSDFDPRQQVACVDSSFDFDQCQAARNGSALSTAAGTYSHIQNSVVMSFRYDSL